GLHHLHDDPHDEEQREKADEQDECSDEVDHSGSALRQLVQLGLLELDAVRDQNEVTHPTQLLQLGIQAQAQASGEVQHTGCGGLLHPAQVDDDDVAGLQRFGDLSRLVVLIQSQADNHRVLLHRGGLALGSPVAGASRGGGVLPVGAVAVGGPNLGASLAGAVGAIVIGVVTTGRAVLTLVALSALGALFEVIPVVRVLVALYAPEPEELLELIAKALSHAWVSFRLLQSLFIGVFVVRYRTGRGPIMLVQTHTKVEPSPFSI